MVDESQKKSVRVGFRVGGDLREALEAEAKKRGGPRERRGDGEGYSDIVRDALMEYLKAGAPRSEAMPPRQAVAAGLDLLKVPGPQRRAIMLIVKSLGEDMMNQAGSGNRPSADNRRTRRSKKAAG